MGRPSLNIDVYDVDAVPADSVMPTTDFDPALITSWIEKAKEKSGAAGKRARGEKGERGVDKATLVDAANEVGLAGVEVVDEETVAEKTFETKGTLVAIADYNFMTVSLTESAAARAKDFEKLQRKLAKAEGLLKEEVVRRKSMVLFVREKMTRLRESRVAMMSKAGNVLKEEFKRRMGGKFVDHLSRLSRHVKENAKVNRLSSMISQVTGRIALYEKVEKDGYKVPAGTYEKLKEDLGGFERKFDELDVLEVTKEDFRYVLTISMTSHDVVSMSIDTALRGDQFGIRDSWESVGSRAMAGREVEDDADSRIPRARISLGTDAAVVDQGAGRSPRGFDPGS
ncbi:hypothetical protein AALP_AA2G101400 [Arabis alpina]|uniref:Uncharacterized protein n=1 Tax=Arabis alpina TaxID=50452 RepID=A0A087HGH1_ARAAL|nr:hypothetical protein AALP_AA2G101400 [Arabis alpina]